MPFNVNMNVIEVYRKNLPTLFTLVDDKDYKILSKYKWRYANLQKYQYTYYPFTRINGKKISMQRLIMKPPMGKTVDHINRNALDNRRINLRICLQQQNSYNNKNRTRYGGKPVSSKYRGVAFQKDIKKYTAKISDNRKRLYLGSYNTAEQAYEAYKKAANIISPQFISL